MPMVWKVWAGLSFVVMFAAGMAVAAVTVPVGQER